MPYTEQELEANEHYTSLKRRDEVKYVANFVKTKSEFVANGGDVLDGLRDSEDALQIYENPDTGGDYDSLSQKLRIMIYQTRYRTNADTKDILDREFKEF